MKMAGAILLFVLLGCSAVAAARARATADGVAETLVVLEHGENALANPSADHRKVLQDVLARLPRGAQEFVRDDLAIFLNRAPDAAADFKCGSDFMRYRTRQELARIKDKLLNANPQRAEPQFCYAVPFALDLTRPIETLEIYGYDLDSEPLELFLIDSDESFTDVSFGLKRKTHYHLTIDLRENGVKFPPNSQMLSVAWGHLLRYSIPLIQPTTELCSSQVQEIPAEKTITYRPLPISGGHFGPGGDVRASAILNYESNKLDLTICMTATDRRTDPTTFSGCGNEYVYTSEPDRVIEAVFGGLQSGIAYSFRNEMTHSMKGSRDGPVSQWTFAVPSAQSTPASEAQITVTLRNIRIVSTKIDNCIPVVAYREAKRTKALSPSTIKRMDSQTKTINPEILKLRPLFAPLS